MDHWVLFCHAYHQTGHNNLYKQIIHVAMQKRRNIGEKGNIGIAFLSFPFLILFFSVHSSILFLNDLGKWLVEDLTVYGIYDIILCARTMYNARRFHFFEMIADGGRRKRKFACYLFNIGVFLQIELCT